MKRSLAMMFNNHRLITQWIWSKSNLDERDAIFVGSSDIVTINKWTFVSPHGIKVDFELNILWSIHWDFLLFKWKWIIAKLSTSFYRHLLHSNKSFKKITNSRNQTYRAKPLPPIAKPVDNFYTLPYHILLYDEHCEHLRQTTPFT